MSDNPYTLDRLHEFLRQAPVAGLLNPAVAKSRGQALEQVQDELTVVERNDLRLIDVDELCGRLHKIGDSSVRPEVLDLYNKRLKATLVDYLAWVQNPKSYASVGGDRVKRSARGDGTSQERLQEMRALEDTLLATSDWAPGIVSIPLREGTSVFVQNLPLDLTEQEARKIARVIEALASDRSTDA
ncbi:MAG: hypothetical protein AB7E72_14105 [Lysobacterales bacterium]